MSNWDPDLLQLFPSSVFLSMSPKLHIEEGICILATHSVGQGPGPTHPCFQDLE